MTEFTPRHVEFGRPRRRPAIGGDLLKRAAGRRSEHDHALAAPAAAEAIGRIADGDRRAAADRCLLQFAVGEESQPFAVRREEWAHSAKVPGRGRAVPESSARTISCVVLPRPATYTIERPSGDIVTAPSSVVAMRSSSGNVIENLTSFEPDEPSRCQAREARTPTSRPAATNAAARSHERLRDVVEPAACDLPDRSAPPSMRCHRVPA